jgi:hypothetical protein
MSESRSLSLVTFAAIAAIAAVALIGGFGGSETTAQTETFEFVVEDHDVGDGVVVEIAERGGFSLLGFKVSQPDHYVRVAFTLPMPCDVDGAVYWPLSAPGCAGPEGLAGTIAGSGITAAGGPILLVEALVDADCFSRIELGASWPPSACETW